MRSTCSLLSLLLIVMLTGCGETMITESAEIISSPDLEQAPTSLSKVDTYEDIWVYDLDDAPPYDDCSTGAPMQNHGFLEIHDVYKTTPSGHTIISSWVDYDALGGVTLENLVTGEIWTLVNGHNPATYLYHANGSFMLAYQWTDLYKLDKRTLHIHLKGHIKINADGTVEINRESYTCR